jgi:DNA-binding NarL/FixJ family response regulator
VMTSSRADSDLFDTYQLGVSAYVVKPVKFLDFVAAVKHLGCFWGLINKPPPSTAAV